MSLSRCACFSSNMRRVGDVFGTTPEAPAAKPDVPFPLFGSSMREFMNERLWLAECSAFNTPNEGRDALRKRATPFSLRLGAGCMAECCGAGATLLSPNMVVLAVRLHRETRSCLGIRALYCPLWRVPPCAQQRVGEGDKLTTSM